jgi:hypothetical protein
MMMGGAVLAVSACVLPLTITFEDDGPRVYGSGHAVTTSADVDQFDAIAARGPVHVVVTRTGRERVSLTAEDNLLPYLEWEVRGRTLHVGARPGTRLAPTREILVRIESWEVVELDGEGAVDMEVDLGQVDALGIRLSGASRLVAWGQAGGQDVELSGASRLDALDVASDRIRLRASGASEAVVWARRRLDVEASGASHVRFKGNPALTMRVSGVSTVARY